MTDDIIRSFGYLTLGSRLKRIGEALQADTQKIVDGFALDIQSSQYPLLAALDRQGPLAVGQMAEAIGISQPGVTRTLGTLSRLGLIGVRTVPGDQRRRVASLTDKGRNLVKVSKDNVWPRIEAAVQDLCAQLSAPLLEQLTSMERGLAARPLDKRDGLFTGPDQGHVLDRPFWAALTSKQAPMSVGGALARRYEAGLIPFVAIASNDAASALAASRLFEPGETLYLVQQDPPPEIPATEVVGRARVVQMVCEQPLAPEAIDAIERLSASDAEEMLALANLTKPGPFVLRAGELGEFWGVKIDGRLAAMAGTRIVLDGYTELSGVCTHPDFQGRGLARKLSVFVARRFIERGEIPFLHAFDTNERAIRLYESIGFRIRTKLNVTMLKGI